MATVPVIAPTADAIAAQVPFNLNTYPAIGGTAVASGLAGAEVVTIFIAGSAGWAPYVNPADGSPAVLTATEASCELLPGARYGFTKSASVAPAAVDVVVAS